MPDFYPPQLNPPLVRLSQWAAPLWAHWWYQIDLQIDAESLNQLAALRDQKVLLLPNHPTFQDPIVMFLLSGKGNQTFYYLAAHEVFSGVLSRFFQALGVYSIRRGLADRASIAQTLDLLTQPGCHLVVFPEGGCSFQNDTVMPFRAGAIQLAFQAISRWVKQGKSPPDLYAVPISIKYRYTQNMAPIIAATLHQLEQALEVPKATGDYERLRAIAEKVLTRIEQEYGIQPIEGSETSWNDRIALLKAHVLKTSEQQLSLTSSASEPDRERGYRILHAVQARSDQVERGDAGDSLWDVEFVRRSMLRLLNFDAIYDGYVATNPTPERFLDTLIRLEREVFAIDKPPPKGHRLAQLKLGDPVNLRDYFERFQKAKSTTVNQVALHLQQAVQHNLDLYYDRH
ncbi:MAG: 1-acyl-sn-glycerol-3-phosphate acyltransferase [Leptolyngbyaceae cyanobacterium RU_5_1]|nr:1-acyl-sn-glycerol-3-phosphate acyltransferase [Leptolyngbyaceae cyanobacterium RU_5_1]